MDVYGIRDANNEVRTRVPMLIGLLLLLLLAGCTSAPATQSEQAQSAEPRDDVVAGASIAKIATKSGPSGAKVSASPPSKKNGTALELIKQKTSLPLDLTSLEKRLKGTSAINVLDKIAFRNQVDDLLGQFRAFYQGTLNTTLVELRRPYDLLILELLALLGDKDPSLAAAVVASREAIWVILADPVKFATI
jgi:hypothetical protein